MSSPPRHRAFSLARIAAIASNTLLELVRMKVFYFMLLFALAIIGSSAFTVKFSFQQQFQVLKDVSLGAMSIFSWLLATLATAMMLPKDIEDRTLYTILAKPVPRFEYLLGKFFGVLLMLAIALSLMTLVFAGVLYAREQVVLAETMRGYPPGPELDEALRQIRASTFNANLLPGILLVYLKAAIVAAVTLLISTFASSWIFTVLVSMMVYFIGHVQPIAREYWLTQMPGATAASPLLTAFLGFVSIVFPDFQLFTLVDDIAAGNAVSLDMFLKTGGLGLGYVFIYTLVAYVLFANKEL
ncbi:MAG: ABC transporter permease subunit [Verrucomicrobiota bacterium]|nr:ABC transporter permease subunit [Verrucomicrobiota bacterium]